MGPDWGDDGTPVGFPRPHTDHDLTVVSIENVDNPGDPKPLANIVNMGQHPEDLDGYDLITGEYPAIAERLVDRSVGGVSIFTQNATGTSEVEADLWHPVHDRAIFDHAQYQQMEWAGRLLADGVIENVNDIRAQQPNGDTSPTFYGGTPYSERFVPWMTDFPVAMEDRWFGGPVSHPYPGRLVVPHRLRARGQPARADRRPAGLHRGAGRQHGSSRSSRRPVRSSRGSPPTTSRSSGYRSPRTTRRRRTQGSRTRSASTCRRSAWATSSSPSARASSGPTSRSTSRRARTRSPETSTWATTRPIRTRATGSSARRTRTARTRTTARAPAPGRAR